MASLEELLAKSIPELKQRYVDRARPVPKGLVEALESDTRQGAHQLAKQIRERWPQQEFKWLSGVRFVDRLPMTAAGKLDRAKLRPQSMTEFSYKC